MSLTIDNPDRQGVRKGFADEEIDFWDLPNQHEHFFPNDKKCAEELFQLVQDKYRITRQCNELSKLNPLHAATYFYQHTEAVNAIENGIKKLLGNRVAFKPNSPPGAA